MLSGRMHVLNFSVNCLTVGYMVNGLSISERHKTRTIDNSGCKRGGSIFRQAVVVLDVVEAEEYYHA